MKLPSKEKAKILQVYNSYWEGYLSGDVAGMSKLLSNKYTQVGSAEAEVFSNKKDAVKFLHDTIDQVAGRAEIRNQSITLEYLGDHVLVNDLFDIYMLTDEVWVYYARLRASTLMYEEKGNWKFIHQHSSIPDMRTHDQVNLATEKISAENLALKDAIKRRTIELEQKNRELEIEAALEKVRSRSLTMHKSDELSEVILEVRSKFQELDISMESRVAVVVVFDKNSRDFNQWVASPDFANIYISTPYFKNPILEDFWTAKEGDVDFYSNRYSLKVKNSYFKYFFEHSIYKNIGLEEQKKWVFEQEFYTYSPAIEENSSIGIADFSGKELTDSEIEIVKRFAKVFEQAYIRFLDLQKAEEQAREAQIETALERIRAKALAMHGSEELMDVAQVMREQMGSLGQSELIGSVIHVYPEDSEFFHSSYSFSPDQKRRKVVTGTATYRKDATTLTRKMLKMYHSKNNENTIKTSGSELKDWINVRNKEIPYFANVKTSRQPAIVFYHFSDFSGGSLVMASQEEPSQQAKELQHRAAAVFDLAYRRFLDLQKAEAQAREAEIELALERVRARTMAMQSSNELPEAANVLFQQIEALGVSAWSCGYNIFGEDKKSSTCWMSSEGELQESFILPFAKEASFLEWNKVIKRNQKFFVQELGGKALKSHYAYMKSLPDVGIIIKKLEDTGISLPTYQINHLSFFSHGFLLFITYKPVPEMHEIFQRFTKVFEQTYTRFLDLQKAEEQAREAQIEAALERVRAKTMAMRKSDELLEAAGLLYKELSNLGIVSLTSGYGLMDKEEKIVWYYTASPEDGSIMPEPLGTPYNETKVMRSIAKSWKKQEPSHVIKLNPQETIDHQTFIAERSTNFHYTAEELISFSPERLVLHTFNFKQGHLLIVGGEKLAADQIEMMIRFTKAFEQTYTRYLDLQKAESQAREAQIEAALERVRSRSLAMHKSDELQEVIQVVYEQMVHLNINAEHAGFAVDYKQGDSWDYWVADPNITSKVTVPRFESVWSNQLDSALKRGDDFYATQLDFKQKNKFYKDLLKHVPSATKKARDFYLNCPGLAVSTVIQEDVLLYIENFSGTPYTVEENDILSRFGKVFQQTYTRFLDLQKAEEQAREAQIEASLERVRSSTMAMHKSEDLLASANLLYNEFKSLGITQYFSCGFVIVDEENKVQHVWVTDMDGEIFESFNLPLLGDPVFQQRYEKWQQKVPVIYQKVAGAKLKKHLAFAIPHFGSEKAEEMVANQFPDPTYFYMANFSHGYLHIVGDTKLTDDEEQLLARFTGVFQQTYTRFLDLQKAEEQAREAQIEVALERVRASSMAMHHSHELPDMALTVLNQLDFLGIQDMLCSINIVNPDTKSFVSYSAVGIEASNKKVRDQLPEMSMNDVGFLKTVADRLEKGQSFFTLELKNADLKEMLELWKASNFSGLKNKNIAKKPEVIYLDCFQINELSTISVSSTQSLTEEQVSILQRMTSTFSLSYTRFLDLLKAEEQTREAQIETALERVRAITMAMHKSKDLSTAITTVFSQLSELNFTTIRCGIGIFNDRTRRVDAWTASEGEENNTAKLSGDEILEGHPLLEGIFGAWENQQEYSYVLEGDDLKNYYNVTANSNLPVSGPKGNVDNVTQYYHCVMFPAGGLFAFKDKPFTDEEKILMRRFADVFHLTFIRHLDLMQAEAQAREAQIEAALERIRAKALAMHASKELMDVAQVLREQMGALGQSELIGSVIHLYPDNSDFFKSSYSFSPEQKRRKVVTGSTLFRKDATSLTRKWLKFYHSDDNEYTIKISGAELKDWIKVRNKEIRFFAKNKTGKQPSTAFYHGSDFSGGSLIMSSHDEPSQEAKDLQRRAASVFDLAYRRFLDLKKAEEQAREAQIEASLERVRSKSMAMHQSADIGETVSTLFAELLKVGIHKSSRSGIGILNETKDMKLWSALSNSADEVDLLIGNLDMTINPLLKKITNAWKKQDEQFYYELEGKELSDYYASINQSDGYSLRTDLNKLPEKEFIHVFTYKHGIIYSFNSVPISEEAKQVFIRFAKVFEQTYTRFLDLQKAENQAREAQIEASLERVRAKAMAMHSSEDLVDTASQLFKEFQYLKISFIRCGVLKINESRMGEVYSYSLTKENEAIAVYGDLNLTGHELIDGVFEHWQLQKEYVHEMKGDAVKQYYRLVNKQLTIPKVQLQKSHFGYAFYFPEGCLYCFTNEKLPEETLQILRKFNSVMGMTYRRYFELQESEARALATIKESSLDRVRAEIASMRTADDLNRITPLVWSELTTLGVPFFRCGVFIMDVKAEMAHAYLSTPFGSSLTALELKFDSMPLVAGAFKYWQQQKVYIEEWDKKQFIKWTKPLVEQGQIENPKKYQGGEDPPERLVLQMVPFKQGMLYVGSTEKLINEQIELVKSLADSFSVAYARYEDFKQLEEAKGRIENTLSELKSTQTQLIQSEKMASLGELTAGIAHEIQNPLNFVNNFSEVSGELVEEINDEIKAGNLEEVEYITTDLKQNLEKINHHGKRASGIVKGMLEHSRTGSGEKELTDINKLADEYLRLSYHGLRAKDKSFNADFKTAFDESLPKVKVITQDLGRVILNLINNAFYAVAEKTKANDTKYKPIVKVSTKKLKGKIEIIVNDNGHGIPKEIVDKIFQPFFTTKPSGSGTGLGLSMSYDIITKGHGGELKVNTAAGVGTEFLIILPY